MCVHVYIPIFKNNRMRIMQPQQSIYLALQTNSCWSIVTDSQSLLSSVTFFCGFWQQITDIFHKWCFPVSLKHYFPRQPNVIAWRRGEKGSVLLSMSEAVACLGLGAAGTSALVWHSHMSLFLSASHVSSAFPSAQSVLIPLLVRQSSWLVFFIWPWVH